MNAKQLYEEFFHGDETVMPFEALSSRTQDRWRRLEAVVNAPGPDWAAELHGIREALRERKADVRSEVIAVVQRASPEHIKCLIEIMYLQKITVSQVEEILKRCG